MGAPRRGLMEFKQEDLTLDSQYSPNPPPQKKSGTTDHLLWRRRQGSALVLLSSQTSQSVSSKFCNPVGLRR